MNIAAAVVFVLSRGLSRRTASRYSEYYRYTLHVDDSGYKIICRGLVISVHCLSAMGKWA